MGCYLYHELEQSDSAGLDAIINDLRAAKDSETLTFKGTWNCEHCRKPHMPLHHYYIQMYAKNFSCISSAVVYDGSWI